MLFRSFNNSLEQSLAIIAKFHSQNLIHGDLKISNLYYIKKSDGLFKVGIWDFDGSKIKKCPLNHSEREKDIARFVASVLDELNKEGVNADENNFNALVNKFYIKASSDSTFDINNQKHYINKLRKTV